MRSSTALSLAGATLVSGFVGYAIYFDYKRRNDPAFRSQLKKDRKRTSKELKKQSIQKEREVEDAVDRAVKELNKPGVFPVDAAGREEVFMMSVQEGEMLQMRGPELFLAAAAAFYKALKVYPNPMELLAIYTKAVPTPVLDYIRQMVAKDASMPLSSAKNSQSLEDIDDEVPAKTAGAATATATSSPPSAPLSSQGGGSLSGSTNNGDASSQEWEKVSQHDEEEKKAEVAISSAHDEPSAQMEQENV